MSSNGSHDNGNDPWGKRHTDGPPDLLDLIKKFFTSKTSGSGSGDHSGRYLSAGLLVLIVFWALSGIFLVSPAQQAVVLRFGKYLGTVGPGPHWIPRFISSERTVNVQQISTFPYQAEMLTKDENIVFVSVAVQFRIGDLENYFFKVINPVGTLQQATSSALRQVVGQMTLDSVLTTGRKELRDAVEKQLTTTLNHYKAGIEITDVTLQPAKPPEAVTHAFDDAIKAREDEQRYINQAEAYARKMESVAKGKLARLKQSAMAYQKEVTLKAEGRTARYLAILKPYKKSPGVTRERLYLDALSNVLSKTTNILVDGGGNNVLYLPLEQILRQQRQSQDNTSSSEQTTPSFVLSRPNVKSGSVNNAGRPSYPVGESQ